MAETETCGRCGGTGDIPWEGWENAKGWRPVDTCPTCNGTGKKETEGEGMMNSKAVRIVAEQKPSGQWIATSPDVPGFMVAERTLREVWRQVPIVMEAMEAHAQKRGRRDG